MKWPEGWKVLKVKHACYVKARIGWQGLRSSEFTDSGPLLVTGTDFEMGRVNWKGCYHVCDERYREDPYIQLREGDLLITKDGTIGKIAVVQGLPGPATLNSGIFVVRPLGQSYDSRFLRYVLESEVFSGFVEYRSSGTTIDHLYQNVFVDFAFGCPDAEGQARIVEWLDAQTDVVDALISKKQRLIGLLEENRAALVTQAVTQGLDPGAPMRDSGGEWLGRVPGHWDVVPLRRLLHHIEQGTSPVAEEVRANEGEYAVLKLSAVKRGNFDANQHKRLSSLDGLGRVHELRAGDFVITRSNTPELVGDACIVPNGVREKLILPDLMYRLILKTEIIAPEYLLWHFLFGAIRGQLEADARGSSGSMVKIAQSHIRGWRCPVPPPEEQRQIAVWCREVTRGYGATMSKIRDCIDRLREYRSALITAAVTGQLDLRKHEKQMEALA